MAVSRSAVTADIAHRFSRLIFAAVEAPESVDRSALLEAADAFLNAAQAGDPDGLAMARTMAARAMDWCVWSTPEYYNALARAVHAFRMYTAVEQMAN
jgi:hypothetical protein